MIGNYRPVSNLSFLSKLLERVVQKRLSDYLASNDLYNKHQSAYTQHCSTETLLVSVCDKIINAMCTQQITGLCMLDLSAAFDTIDHGILLERLSSWFGINGSALAWLSSFLGDRTFSVKVGESLSEPAPLLYGVPQGSVLVLFSSTCTPLL